MIVAVDIGSGSVRAGLLTRDGIVHVARRVGALALVDGPLIGLDLPELAARVDSALEEVALVAASRRVRVEVITCTSVRYATVWSAPGAVAAWANLSRADPRDVEAVQRRVGAIGAAPGWPTALSLSARLVSARRWGVAPPEGSVPLSLSAWMLTRWGASAHVDAVTWSENRLEDETAWDVPVLSHGASVGEFDGSVAGTRLWRGARLAVCPPDTVAAVHAFPDLGVGDAVAVAGTTTPVVAVADATRPSELETDDDTSWLPFDADRCLAESNVTRTGEAVRAAAHLAGTALDDVETRVSRVGTIRSFLGPSLAAPRRVGERAVPRGIEFADATRSIRPTALLHSVVEANAWATDAHLDRVERQAGHAARRIVCGGQARSGAFLRLLAASGCRPVLAVTDEVTLRGAARAATGENFGVPEMRVVERELDVGDEPLRWAARWWERYQMAARAERVVA